jgi:hypothetical protein
MCTQSETFSMTNTALLYLMGIQLVHWSLRNKNTIHDIKTRRRDLWVWSQDVSNWKVNIKICNLNCYACIFFYITPQAKIKRFQAGINISFPHSVTSKQYHIGLWIPFLSTKQHIQNCIHLTVCYAIRKRIFTTEWVITITVLIYNNVHHN